MIDEIVTYEFCTDYCRRYQKETLTFYLFSAKFAKLLLSGISTLL